MKGVNFFSEGEKSLYLSVLSTPNYFSHGLLWRMQQYAIPFWKSTPFFRLLIPLIAGIILQWYAGFTIIYLMICFGCSICAFMLFNYLQVELRFKLQWLQGILLHLTIVFFAMVLLWHNDSRHSPRWYGHYCNDSSSFVIRITEPLIEKERSFKATAAIEGVFNKEENTPVKGKVQLYFSKDTTVRLLQYGSCILVKKILQPIRNSGNPGAFNYERYSAFHHTFHQVYLTNSDWTLLSEKKTDAFQSFIFSLRSYIVQTIKKYINGSNQETGIAEALLIGYKEDLDKDLVQAYSNAGVVHIIAISGLHLGLIYVMLTQLLNRIPVIRKNKFIKMLLLLGSLWIFSLLTGASASVLRSAVMFTFIVIGKNYFTQSSVYNSLAASAFLLLCYDPYFLWDVGFQLSYLALIGIVGLQQPLNRLVYCKQPWLEKIWSMFTVTLAAQISAFPICLYYFHQFPNLFFITNILAVPLSTIILFAEIFLIAVSGLNFIAVYIGQLTGFMIRIMNKIITGLNSLPYSVWDNIYANIYTTWALHLFVFGFCGWLVYKSSTAFRIAIISLFFYTSFHVYAYLKVRKQVSVIVYNIPKCRAIDFIYGDKYYFIGDSILQKEGQLKNFHLKPARVFLHVGKQDSLLPFLSRSSDLVWFYNKKILLIDKAVDFSLLEEKINIDALIISKNPSLKIASLMDAIRPSMIVFDASNSLWKIAQWKKECLMLALPCFSIPEQGAYVLNIDQQ